MSSGMPNISQGHIDIPSVEKLAPQSVATHAPRILLLYGSLRPSSYSRLLTLEASTILVPRQKSSILTACRLPIASPRIILK